MGTTGSTLRRLPHDRPLLALLVAVLAVEVFDTKVDAKNRSVLGGVPFSIGLVSTEADV